MSVLLLIEDNDDVRVSLASAMRQEGHETVEAVDGRSGLELFARNSIDVVLLDIRLPDVSGFDVCRTLREHSDVAIIMVTAQDDTHDLVAGLEAGADDYVIKPVEPKALAARIRALVRRTNRSPEPSGSVHLGPLELREIEGVLLKAGRPVELTRTEFRLICEFGAHPSQVLSREQLLDRVWGYDYFGDSRLVDAHIRRLRLKVEDRPDDPTLIVTVRGLGYKLAVP